jgi:acyl-CoA synthetase (AMP-forming)/AMP-acid ligase II
MSTTHGAEEWIVGDTLVSAAERDGSKIAVIAGGRSYDYARLLDRALRLARALQDLGLERGGRVVIQAINSWDVAVAIYGVSLAGGVFVVVNAQTKSEKLAYVLHNSSAQFLIVQESLLGVFLEVAEPIPSLSRVILVGSGSRDLPPDGLRFDELVTAADPAPTRHEIALDLAALIYTSGSTGNPKGVMMRHQSMVFTMQSLCRYLRLSRDDRILNFLPLAFDYGLYQLLMAVRLGGTLILEQSFTFPRDIVARASEHQATVFPGVPTVFSGLRGLAREQPGLELPAVRRVTNTAAALPPAITRELRAIFPNALIFAMYGLTECKRVSYLEPELLDERPTSVGRAIPGTEATVLVDGRPAAPGEVGILHVRGPHVMVGYWNLPEQTAEMLVAGPTPGEQMLCTQDSFTVDEQGFLFFVGRTDDIIKSGGQKVSPVEVENALHGLPEVRDAAVVGVPHEAFGEAIRAFVVLHAGASLTEQDVIRTCRGRLEAFMVPHEVVFLPELPSTESGKITKKGLSRSASGESPTRPSTP